MRLLGKCIDPIVPTACPPFHQHIFDGNVVYCIVFFSIYMYVSHIAWYGLKETTYRIEKTLWIYAEATALSEPYGFVFIFMYLRVYTLSVLIYTQIYLCVHYVHLCVWTMCCDSRTRHSSQQSWADNNCVLFLARQNGLWCDVCCCCVCMFVFCLCLLLLWHGHRIEYLHPVPRQQSERNQPAREIGMYRDTRIITFMHALSVMHFKYCINIQ